VSPTASIGVPTCPEDGRTEAELLRSAQEAMNLVKSSTRDGVAGAKVGILVPPLF
jgi:GGDEF domain-containing protein